MLKETESYFATLATRGPVKPPALEVGSPAWNDFKRNSDLATAEFPDPVLDLLERVNALGVSIASTTRGSVDLLSHDYVSIGPVPIARSVIEASARLNFLVEPGMKTELRVARFFLPVTKRCS